MCATGGDGYGSGFGLIAEPYTVVTELQTDVSLPLTNSLNAFLTSAFITPQPKHQTLSRALKTCVFRIESQDQFLIVSSDGLYNEVERGGGGGLTNEQAVEMAIALDKKGLSLDDIAKKMCEESVKLGSTDDITCCLLKLSP